MTSGVDTTFPADNEKVDKADFRAQLQIISDELTALQAKVTVAGLEAFQSLNNNQTRLARLESKTAGMSRSASTTTFTDTLSLTVQPAFLAFNSVVDSNVTGNGATASVEFDTEVFDQGSDFASDTFTAPITGKYFFQVSVGLQNIDGNADTVELILVTSNRSYEKLYDITDGLIANTKVYELSVIADMDAADTAAVTVEVSGMAGDSVDILGENVVNNTRFSGALVG